MSGRRHKTQAEGWTIAGDALAGFPGAALLLGPGEAVIPINAAAAALLARHATLGSELATLARMSAYAGELETLPGTEALLLPLADGARRLALLRDAALAHNLRAALVDSRQRYKDLVEISSDFAWETDADGRFAFVSPQGVAGWAPDTLLGRAAADFLVEPSEGNPFATRVRLAETEVRVRRADGGEALLGIVAAPFGDAAGNLGGVRGIGRDLTLRHERDVALARAELRERLFTHLVRAIRDEVDPEATLAAAVRATGLALGAAGGVVLRRRNEALVAAASWGDPGEQRVIERGTAALDGADDVAAAAVGWQLIGHAARYRQAVEGAILLWRRDEDGGFPESDRALLGDVADQLGVAIAQVAQHEQMRLLSRTDPLTGLLNRRAFFEELERRLRRIERGTRGGVLLFVDMDNFKPVNDRRGHHAGDEAILALCRILASQSRGGDLLVRLGGDEFALWIEGLDEPGAKARAAALLASSRTLAAFSGDVGRPLGISVGVALVEPGGGETPEQIVARADAAMYRAKTSGKGRLVVAPPAALVAP
ncbi:MAG TPA: sensor domain-containing diguanylate cyclase [Stellaceae bacterium]|nr:sensor domain-containing diguanylate cyclase [Stellaceae bacterium]